MSTENKLFETYDLNGIALQNRAVMAPMTRSRATSDHIPTPIMATYYGQRNGAGLIITEGTSPSINGAGYPRIPGIYTDAQAEAWKPVTEAAHMGGAKIFLQVMHTGRVTHPLNLDEGGRVVGPSAIAAATTKMYTDQEGLQELPVPEEMTQADIDEAIAEYVTSAENAVAAGFDGIELHGANGYLIDQFINPLANQREDNYGGSVENRTRFVVEVAEKVGAVIGKEKVGIRLSPLGAFNDLGPFEGAEEQFTHVAASLKDLVTYIHLVDHSAMGAPEVPRALKEVMRDAFGGTVIVCGNYNHERAETDLASGLGHLVAIGRPFISNPDLLVRYQRGGEIAPPDFDTFYTPGEKGYTDYPMMDQS